MSRSHWMTSRRWSYSFKPFKPRKTCYFYFIKSKYTENVEKTKSFHLPALIASANAVGNDRELPKHRDTKQLFLRRADEVGAIAGEEEVTDVVVETEVERWKATSRQQTKPALGGKYFLQVFIIVHMQ